jgi:tRNA pseudouridine38-40 synthase
VRVRLVVAYDGGGFHGFARNDPHPTVGGFLEDALSRVLREPIAITCAGRTDRGVHARGQVVTFDVAADRIDLERVVRSVNGLGGGRVVVHEARVAAPDLDARFSARWRRYRYTVLNRPTPDPFLRHTTWWIPDPLDVAAMEAGGRHLLGEHDFASFCRRPKPVPGAEVAPSLVRRVLDLGWEERPEGLVVLDIRATAFCHQMVRSITGLLVDVGRGRIAPDAVAGALAARDRGRVPTIAPPHGLCLWEVGYDGP